MVSEPLECPLKKGYKYAHVILLTENMTLPMLVPYLWKDDSKNDLTQWLLINSKGYRARHSIAQYHSV